MRSIGVIMRLQEAASTTHSSLRKAIRSGNPKPSTGRRLLPTKPVRTHRGCWLVGTNCWMNSPEVSGQSEQSLFGCRENLDEISDATADLIPYLSHAFHRLALWILKG